MGIPKIGACLGVPMMRILLYLALYLAALFLEGFRCSFRKPWDQKNGPLLFGLSVQPDTASLFFSERPLLEAYNGRPSGSTHFLGTSYT